LQLATATGSGDDSQLNVGAAKRRAQRVQSTPLPPQQRPSSQAPLWQSASVLHDLPGAHAPQAPPQSVSLSFASRCPLPQPEQAPFTQGKPSQSSSPLQELPSAQRAQRRSLPPQSMSLSSPFSAPSSQGCVRQTPAEQNPLPHCASRVQGRSSGQRPQRLSPQSTTGSLPLRTPSSQLGAWQQRTDPGPQPALPQTALVQSAATAHACTLVHSAGQLPPQSVSVSSWLRTWSAQVGGTQRPSSQTEL
jgi:hypothetical protein